MKMKYIYFPMKGGIRKRYNIRRNRFEQGTPIKFYGDKELWSLYFPHERELSQIVKILFSKFE